ncbi:MAG: hypothetical protein Q8L54_07460 [Devosia sp.]|nr:hypothetical protein [Devosia sp.]
MNMDLIRPGRPGRGYDPTAHFTDLRWYLFHQRNVVYFAAFSTRDHDRPAALALARRVVRLLPHLGEGHRGAAPGRPPGDDLLERLIGIETIDGFAGLPDRWIGDGMAALSDPGLPFFRVRIGRLADGPDAEGRRSFLLIQASHALAEGADSARLSRSREAAHPAGTARRSTPAAIRFAARAFAALAVPMHLLVARIWTPHSGTIRVETRMFPRALFSRLARKLGVRQRVLFMALVAHVITGAGSRAGRRRVSATYSTLDSEGGDRDPFMRMRMLFASFENHPEFGAFARKLDARLAAAEASESGFNAEMNAAAVAFHRRLAMRFPWLYSPKVFAFMPYDFVFALIPPHRLAGPLTEGLVEPVYCGATTPGINGCVVVPGRTMVTFNFYLEENLLPRIERLDRILGPDLPPA